MDFGRLKDAIQGQVFDDEETRDELAFDFGRLAQRRPSAVVVPAVVEDVERILKTANQEGFSLVARGSGHSQGGQSLIESGAILDCSGLNRIGRRDGESIWAEAGVLWRDLVREILPAGYLPKVLTDDLNSTIGGTLSTGGLGAASHVFGTQADNVDALEVVTGDGHRVICSSRENQELFDAVRCGLGQFGVIVRAKLRLRRCGSQVRTFFLLYDDLRILLQDQEKLITERRLDYIECGCAPCTQGFRSLGEASVPFAEWFYPMRLSLEFDSEPPAEDSVLEGLHHYRKLHVEDSSIQQFCVRMEALFDHWKESGAWRLAHPWTEAILPWERSAAFIEGVLKGLPPNLIAGGRVLLRPLRSETCLSPMFKQPGGMLMLGFGIHPSLPKQIVSKVLPMLRKAGDLSVQVGGKRCLSGWIEFDEEQWKDHFGALWPKAAQWKRFYDPSAILNPGFVPF